MSGKVDNFSKKCPFCRHTFLGDGKFLFLRRNPEMSYRVCSACKGGILSPRPTKESVSRIYRSENYFSSLSKPLDNRLIQWFFTLRLFESAYDWIDSKFSKNGDILDVGCGNGEFLEKLKERGWKVWGIDISKIAVRNTSEKIGRDRARIGEFSRMKFSKKFDIITFWHVLEHLNNPVSYLKKACGLLKRDGVVAGEVPNFDSLIFRMFTGSYNWLVIPEHVVYFSKKSLEESLKRAGFKKIEFYFPPRALMNFSLSFVNFLGIKNIYLKWFIVSLLLPFSATFVLISSKFGRGEVIRFIARK